MNTHQQVSQRKNDHVRLALQQQDLNRASDFEQVRIVHQALAPYQLDQVDTKTTWANHQHSWPFFINAMTGGSPETQAYNQQLAELAAACDLAMASGSVSAALAYPDLADSFKIIRHANPKGFVMANIGAHHQLDTAKKAVDLLEANALQIHLNVPQELVMPEGDRDFSMWLNHIEAIVAGLNVPVIVKEVGFGMSQTVIKQLLNCGVQTIDLAGRGGTNFIQIENQRRPHADFDLIADWGLSTVESLLESQAYQAQIEVIASGGIRHELDILKALALGAKTVGLSGPFLKLIHENGLTASIETVKAWQDRLKKLMLMSASPDINALRQTDLLLGPSLINFAQSRQIDYKTLAQRYQG